MLDVKKQKRILWILIVCGYIMAAAVLPLIVRVVAAGLVWQPIDPGYVVLLMVINLIVWIPAAFITFRILKRSGFKAAVIFAIALVVLTFLLMQGCWRIG